MAANDGTSGGVGVKLVRVDDERDGQRIDNFLLGQLKGAPRSLIYRILRTGEVRINGKRAKPDTRLAGGDHLHFTMLVNGVAVNPVEWWDGHWMEDRVFRKIRDAGGQAPTLK